MKLRERVEESGLSVADVANRARISEARVRKLLAGTEATVVELRELADALGVTIADFLPEAEPQKELALLFRQSIAQSKKRRAVAPITSLATQAGHAFEILPGAGSEPQWTSRLGGSTQSYQDAEVAAEGFRRIFASDNQLMPLLDLPTIAVEPLGVLLYLVNHDQFEGASALIRGYPFVFLARRTFRPRMLFTLAHEIGHLIAHHGAGSFAVIDVPGDVEQIKSRGRAGEAFADAYASCLLLPRAGVGIALRRVRQALSVEADAIGDIELLYLARFFGVSFQVAARRCENLRLLPTGGAAALQERLTKQHRSPEAYADELGLPPRADIEFPAVPPLLVKDAIEAVRQGRLSVGRASAVLGLSIADIFQLHAGAWQPT